MAPLINVCTTAEEDRAEFMLDAGSPTSCPTCMQYVLSHWHTPVANTTLYSGSFDMSSTRLTSSGDGAVAGVFDTIGVY